jgi:DNA-binding NarL/FixJ family response regulator
MNDAPQAPNRRVRVGLVEDDPRIRQGLAVLIGASPGFECIGDFPNGEEALAALPTLAPDVVLMDINLPGMSGIECIRQLKKRLPTTQLVMLTVFEDHERIFQSLSAGASGYLLKSTPPARLLEAVLEVHQGGAPMSAQIARCVVDAFRKPPPPEASPSQLSPREQEILALLAKGFLYKEIADQLRLSVETVRTHLRNIYEKLHVRSRTEAVMKVYGR